MYRFKTVPRKARCEVSIPKTPIRAKNDDFYFPCFYDKDGKYLENRDIARDLTEYYTLMKKQEECGKTGHIKVLTIFNQENDCEEEVLAPFCWKCGADLTKGAKT